MNGSDSGSLKQSARQTRCMRLLASLAMAVLLLSGCVPTGSGNAKPKEAGQVAVQTFPAWFEDKAGYDQALSAVKETGKPALVYIYATWCPHCKEFSANILKNRKVRQVLSQYPHVRIAPEHGQAEEQLQEEYAVQGYPSFYVVRDPARPIQVLTYTGQRSKTPEEFIDSIRQAAEEAR